MVWQFYFPQSVTERYLTWSHAYFSPLWFPWPYWTSCACIRIISHLSKIRLSSSAIPQSFSPNSTCKKGLLAQIPDGNVNIENNPHPVAIVCTFLTFSRNDLFSSNGVIAWASLKIGQINSDRDFLCFVLRFVFNLQELSTKSERVLEIRVVFKHRKDPMILL